MTGALFAVCKATVNTFLIKQIYSYEIASN